MPKGFFTQCVTVLLKQTVTVGEIESLLGAFKIVKRLETSEHWEFSGPSLILSYRPEVNGCVSVDIVDRPWPDHLGDPAKEPRLFGAWSMGHFGPYAFPGGLGRAALHSYVCKPGKEFAAQHKAFMRVLVSYGFGAAKDDPVIPEDRKPVDELEFITRVAMDLLQHPAALCYFNPNGEILAERPFMTRVIEHYRNVNLPPVDLWCNRRRFKLDDGWMMMDTVGMQQLDLDDIETCFRCDRFDANDIGAFLANTSLYLIGAGSRIEDGETIDGPGGKHLRAKHFEEAVVTPPRPTLRFRPDDGTMPPPQCGFEPPPKAKGWKFWK